MERGFKSLTAEIARFRGGSEYSQHIIGWAIGPKSGRISPMCVRIEGLGIHRGYRRPYRGSTYCNHRGGGIRYNVPKMG